MTKITIEEAVVILHQEVKRVNLKNQIMRHALEKLSNPDNWSEDDVSNFTIKFDYALPQEIAQQALQEIEKL